MAFWWWEGDLLARELANCQPVGHLTESPESFWADIERQYAEGIREPVIAVTGPLVFEVQKMLARRNVAYTKGPWFYGNGNIFEIRGKVP